MRTRDSDKELKLLTEEISVMDSESAGSFNTSDLKMKVQNVSIAWMLWYKSDRLQQNENENENEIDSNVIDNRLLYWFTSLNLLRI